MSKKSAASAPAASRWPDAARRHGCPRLISHGALLCADARRRTRDTVDDSDISPAPRAPPLNPFLDSGAQNWAQYLKYLFADDRLAPLVKIRERKLARRRPEQNHFLDGFGQRLKGCFQIKIEMRDQALQHLKIKGVAPVPAFDRARCERKRRMRNNPFRVKHRLLAQAIAFRTRAQRTVE